MTVTADTITDEQIRELQTTLRTGLASLANDPRFWTTHLRSAITETEWALARGEPLRSLTARARCAEIWNATMPGFADTASDVMHGRLKP